MNGNITVLRLLKQHKRKGVEIDPFIIPIVNLLKFEEVKEKEQVLQPALFCDIILQ